MNKIHDRKTIIVIIITLIILETIRRLRVIEYQCRRA